MWLLTGCISWCRWAPASPSRWSSVDTLSLDKVCAPAEWVLATAWTAQTVWTSPPRSDPTATEILRREDSCLCCSHAEHLVSSWKRDHRFLPSSFSGLLQRISMNGSPSVVLCLTRASLLPQQKRLCSFPTQWVAYREHVLTINLIFTYNCNQMTYHCGFQL